ncbi:MAG: hypothetical protein IJ710_04120 [Prevotella sp.]|nr:hypothetical protein [Prevotella sp.]
MDQLTRELRTFLVKMGMQPETVSDKTEHYMEHLLHLLEAEDEEAVVHYFGLFGEEQLGLGELAAERNLEPEAMLERINQCLRRLAVTPEWQLIVRTRKQ